MILTERQWENLKLMNVAGVPTSELAKKYKISESSIRAERSKDKAWQAAFAKVEKFRKAQESQRKSSALMEVAEGTTEALTAIGKGTALHMANLTAKQLQALKAEDLPDLTSWKAIQTAFNINQAATGQNRPVIAAQINIGAAFAPSKEDEIIEV